MNIILIIDGTNMGKSFEYINKSLYFVLRPAQDTEKGTFFYCSGVDILRFLPITKGRHRPMSNPVMRGLQLVNLDVRALALSRGATPKAIRGEHCTGIVPPGDGWYKEMLLIENAPGYLPDEIISHCVVTLLKKTFRAILLPEDELPDTLLKPDELQDVIESLCRKYGGG
ncbi:MAG: hypothetical protein C4538_11185 [Nitrospiraceae bacterium]|nr:MAG: hypothetical protein C4538_11185 [Nitrospiraceae bacterium]